MDRSHSMSRAFVLVLAVLAARVEAQQFSAPGGPIATPGAPVAVPTQPGAAPAQTLPYGGTPVLRVAPDGVVHLDGPGAQYSRPTYGVPQGPVVGQPMGVQSTGVGSRFANWLYNDPVPWQYIHRSGFYGDYTYIRPRNAEVAYGLPIDGVVDLGDEVPIGPVAIVDHQFDHGFRAGVVLRLADGASVRGQYSYLRNSAADSAKIDAPNVIRSLVAHPLSTNTATDTLDAAAAQDINYDLVDIDYRGLILGCESCDPPDCRGAILVNAIVGGRYGMMEQQFQSVFAVTGVRTVDTNIDFDGGGIRLGLEAEHHSTTTGFYVYGSGVSNLMVGEFEADYRQIHSNNGQEVFTAWKAGRVVPTLDLELGAGWVGPRRRLKFSGGYLVSTWFNVVKTDEWINAVQTSNYDDLSGVLTFDGLVARATWEF